MYAVNRTFFETGVCVSMPKMKTHKGAARRFKVTGTGKIMRTKHMKSHFRRRKSPRVKRMFDRMLPLDPSQESNVKRLLPYGTA
jgi:large subunit ribosomal protein L35